MRQRGGTPRLAALGVSDRQVAAKAVGWATQCPAWLGVRERSGSGGGLEWRTDSEAQDRRRTQGPRVASRGDEEGGPGELVRAGGWDERKGRYVCAHDYF